MDAFLFSLTDRFDIVPVRIQYIRRIVAVVVSGAYARLAVVVALHAQSARMKQIYAFPARGAKGQMDRCCHIAGADQPEPWIAILAKSSPPSFTFGCLHGQDFFQPDRLKRGAIEGPRALEVRYGYFDVVDHTFGGLGRIRPL